MKKYFMLDTKTGTLRLGFLGKFETMFDAMNEAGEVDDVIWIMDEEDAVMLLRDFENCVGSDSIKFTLDI